MTVSMTDIERHLLLIPRSKILKRKMRLFSDMIIKKFKEFLQWKYKMLNKMIKIIRI